MLTIRLLGPMDVEIDGEPLPPLRSYKGRWLLALLVLRAGKDASRDWLAETLWPDSELAAGRTNLRQSLSDLKRALATEGARLVATQDTIRFDPTGADIDVLAFDAAVKASEAKEQERTLALYRGALLEGVTEVWVLGEREARQQAYLKTLEMLAAEATATGDLTRAASLLRRGASVDIFRQSLHRALMQTLEKSGDAAGAMQVYYELRNRLHAEYQTEPQTETTACYRQIRDRTGPTPTAPPLVALKPPPLPRPLTELIGRKKERAAVKAKLLTSRLVTLTGIGGVGKTRLALHVAQELESDYRDGVWFADLTALNDSAFVPQTLSALFGVQEVPARSRLETLTDFLRPRQLLLVLDNCEHLHEACAQLAKSLLSACLQLRLLATSRQKLGLIGESVVPVPPLELPPLDGQANLSKGLKPLAEGPAANRSAGQNPFVVEVNEREVSENPAVQLFTKRVVAVRGEFEWMPEDIEAAVHICRRLDGLPLALELAAAQADALSITEIAAQIENRFPELMSEDVTLPGRHQTLRAMLDWSYALLTEPERVLLRRLSVFAGGWTLAAAEAACGNEEGRRRNTASLPIPGPSLRTQSSELSIHQSSFITHHSRLVAKSLVAMEESEVGTRYRLLETVREYGRERLEAQGEAEGLRWRHGQVFLSLAEEAKPHLTGAEQSQWLHRLNTEHDNLRTALAYFLSAEAAQSPEHPQPTTSHQSPALRLATALGRFWQIRGYFEEGRWWLKQAREQAKEHDTVWADALRWEGNLVSFQGEYALARSLFEKSLILCRAQQDREGEAASLGCLALVKKDQGETAKARHLFEESLALWRECNVPGEIASALGYLGILAATQGDYPAAGAFYTESLQRRREQNDRWGIAASLNNLGILARLEKRPERALAHLVESLSLRRELGDRRSTAITLNQLGYLALDMGDVMQARDYFSESLALCRQIGDRRSLAYSLEALAHLACREEETGRAVTLLAAAGALRDVIGSPPPPEDRRAQEDLLASARANLGEARFMERWVAGKSQSEME